MANLSPAFPTAIRPWRDAATAALIVLAVACSGIGFVWLRAYRERCLTAGMNDFLAAPFRPEEISAAVEHAHGPLFAPA